MARGKKTGGRKKGTPNKVTSEAKVVAIAFLNRRTEAELDELWEAAKAESASKALTTYLGALEFVMPKLNRTELTGKDGSSVVFRIEDD